MATTCASLLETLAFPLLKCPGVVVAITDQIARAPDSWHASGEMRRLFVTILLPAISAMAIACADNSTAGPSGTMEDDASDAPIAQ